MTDYIDPYRGFPTRQVLGVSPLCIMLEIHHSGWEPSLCCSHGLKIQTSVTSPIRYNLCCPSNRRGLFVGWLLNVSATCQCISGTDLLWQIYALPHWDRSCRSNSPTDTGPTSPSTDHITPGAWQDGHWTANFEVTLMTWHRKILAHARFEHRIFRSRPMRQ